MYKTSHHSDTSKTATKMTLFNSTLTIRRCDGE